MAVLFSYVKISNSYVIILSEVRSCQSKITL